MKHGKRTITREGIALVLSAAVAAVADAEGTGNGCGQTCP